MKNTINKILDERKRKIDSGIYEKPEDIEFDKLIGRFGNMIYGITMPIPQSEVERAEYINKMIKLNRLTGKDKEEFEAKINEIAENYNKTRKGE